MHQVIQTVKYPECTDHYRRLTDAHKCEDQPDYDKRNTVDHFFDTHRLLIGL